MEVGVHHQRVDNHIVHNHNMNNGQGPAKGRGHKHHSHGKAKTLPTSGHEFRSPDRGVQEDDHNRLKVPKDEEMRQQTQKVMEAFLQSIVAKNGVAERIRKESRERFERENDLEDDRVSTSGSIQQYRSVKPTRVPLRQESNDEKLRKIMSGQMSQRIRHQSDLSLVSSDSADSSAQKGGFHRTKSFTKAQRHPVLADIENRTKKQAASRRSSEDVPQTSSLYLVEPVLDESAFETVKQTSPISHSRASSDPVIAKYDTTGRFKAQKKEKDTWGRFKKKFKKKKDAQKLKDDSRASATSGEAAAATYPGHSAKVTKSHSERRAITREDSTTSRRRSPSPPGIIKRLSSRKKKSSGKPESSSSQKVFSKNASSSRSFDDIDEDTLETANGDAKSNSLPMEVSLSTKPHNHHSHKKHESKHKENWHHSSAVATDGVSDHPSKSGKKGRRDSYEVQRPNTLELPKNKKPKNWRKKFMNILFDSSSSSSSSSSESTYSSAEDLNEAIRGVLDRESRESEVSVQAQRSSRNIKHSNSDNQPSVNNVRGRYQHRSSLSMSDMDRQNKNISEIAKKLRRVAEGYGHIIAQQYAGPAGRTHTPDSYRQDMQRIAHHGGEAPVTRSSSQTTPSGRVPSASMKAYYNMAAASRTPSSSETGGRRPRQRITRAEIFHRPSGSFDSPHREPVTTDSWSDRIETERSLRSQIHVVHHNQRREESPLLRRSEDASHSPPHPSESAASQRRFRSPPMSRQSPPHHHGHSADSHSARTSRGSPRTQPPPPTKSESPNLRSSRLRRFPAGSQSSALPNTVATDHHPHHNVHYERHLDRTITARSPRLTRTVHTHRDIVGDMVEADALPSVLTDDGDSTDVDMATAFGEDDDITVFTESRTETITTTEEIDGAPSLAATGGRQRSATSHSRIPATRFDDDDEELDADEDELGAVGGAETEEIDEDKLVDKLVEALCKKGDQYNDELETPQLEKGITKLLTKLSKDKVKEVVERALAKINEQTAAFRHPEIIELALIFNMADLIGRITTRATYLTGLLDSFIYPIVKRFGGWGSTLQNSLDETEREIIDLDKDVPSTSEQNHRDKHRRDSDASNPDPELD